MKPGQWVIILVIMGVDLFFIIRSYIKISNDGQALTFSFMRALIVYSLLISMVIEVNELQNKVVKKPCPTLIKADNVYYIDSTKQ